jgi:class 3 adenylate cyclase
MDPVVRYCTSADGTRIGYTTYGDMDEVPVVLGCGWVYTQESIFAIPQAQEVYEGLASGSGVIGWDRRGTGRSGPALTELTVDLELADLEAVVDAVGVKTFDIFAYDANPAVPYAARHPERVRRLVLYDPLLGPRPYGKMVDTVKEDWAIARRALAAFLFPNGPVDLQKTWSNSMRDGTSADNAAAYMRYESTLDLREFPPLVQAPTLVIRPGASNFVPSQAEVAAALIPDARLVRMEQPDPWFTDPDALLSYVCEFLGRSARLGVTEQEPSGGTAVIFFADIVDSTALSEQLGDAVFRERSRTLEERVRAHIAGHGGTSVEGRTLGDGVLATFASASEAIAAALVCASAGDELGLALHLGVHAGDVIREDANVYGQAVSIASRVSALSAPNEVLVSGTVRDLARASAGVSFDDRGERELKGVSEPVRVFAVRAALRSE